MYRTRRTTTESPSTFLAPVLALGMWNPFLTEALKGNAQAHESFGAIVSEWQEFLGRRMKEDMALMQRLTQSRPGPSNGLHRTSGDNHALPL